MNREQRSVELELRATGNNGRTLTGHAAVFNQVVDIGGKFKEKFAPGAFTQSIQADDVRALWNHDSGSILGRKSAGTLRLSEDSRGLAVQIDLPDTSLGRDVALSVERRDITGMSLSFIALDEEWDANLRTVKRAQVLEVSPVSFPAYPQTDLTLRSADRVWEERQQALIGGYRNELLRLTLELEALRY